MEAAKKVRPQRHDFGGDLAVRLRVLTGELRRDDAKIRLRLLCRYAGAQPPETFQYPLPRRFRSTSLYPCFGSHTSGSGWVERLSNRRSSRPQGHHAHHRERVGVVETQRSADDRGVAAEPLAPH